MAMVVNCRSVLPSALLINQPHHRRTNAPHGQPRAPDAVKTGEKSIARGILFVEVEVGQNVIVPVTHGDIAPFALMAATSTV